ncbi:hypothetical protein CY0110_27695 [Crocosphaera chwakensis CCY0110]|uniref:Uncharacterized protein n=1 Tax=Crocosphaera chwakensis CCY0110 TaxID=391612 RepID=A3IR79_9CHRO|nr:hypothetical protein CY0110_27695 [Crocosphaera chwakensis CCY0110]
MSLLKDNFSDAFVPLKILFFKFLSRRLKKMKIIKDFKSLIMLLIFGFFLSVITTAVAYSVFFPLSSIEFSIFWVFKILILQVVFITIGSIGFLKYKKK